MPQLTYIVEHLDPELEAWSSLEYASIARESHSSGSQFFLSSLPESLDVPADLKKLVEDGVLGWEHRSVEDIYPGPDGKGKICLLDPKAEKELEPADGERFEVFLFGGILGDDPPRDRTSELRQKGFEGRRLGPIQMTTDTAARVTRIVVQDKVPVDQVPYVDFPEIRVNKNESTEMPFRYVKKEDGGPVMPEGMIDLIKKDSEKGLGDLL